MFPHFNTRPLAEAYLTGLGYVETAIGLWTGPDGDLAAVTPFCGDVVQISAWGRK